MRNGSSFKKEILNLFFVGLLFLSAAACASTNENARYLDEGKNHVVRLEKGKPAPSYSHPADLDPAVWAKALRSIVVSHTVPLLKRILTQKNEIVEPAFTAQEATFLANRLQAAAEQATSEEHVAFLLISNESHMTTEITSGIAFLKGGALHLIFANHRTPLATHRHPQVPRDAFLWPYEPGSFQLVVQPHQARLGKDLLEKGQEGLAIDYASVGADAAPAATEGGSKAPLPFAASGMEERFQLLKKLRDGGLITEEEYTEKKSELLKMFDTK